MLTKKVFAFSDDELNVLRAAASVLKDVTAAVDSEPPTTQLDFVQADGTPFNMRGMVEFFGEAARALETRCPLSDTM